ncbi:MAG: hypothetical protein NW200_03645 [Hyphomonadaceae bacterium]|nr:hypothetical protein [Hyphomonadaceae bacterium]
MVTTTAAAWIWMALGGYAAAGLLAWAALVAIPARRLDLARAPWRVRLLILPGTLALWPLLVARAAGLRAPEDRP